MSDMSWLRDDERRAQNAIDSILRQREGNQIWVSLLGGEANALVERLRRVEAERDELKFRLDGLDK